MTDEERRRQEEIKNATKEAIKEWMEEKYAALGKWALGSFVAMVVAALTYFILMINGWHR